MLGWRPWSEMATYYRESNVGINIDALHYETIFGTRTRLVEMIASGLPVVTSLGAELSYLLRDAGVALTFEVGDWQMLGQNLAQMAANPALTCEHGGWPPIAMPRRTCRLLLRRCRCASGCRTGPGT